MNLFSFLLQKEFLDECIFNEMIEQSYYNTYSSARYSNHRRTMYLALNRRGQPRKVQIRNQQQLGKLSIYARVLTQPVSPERVEDLIGRLGAAQPHTHNGTAHPLRHHGSATGHLCASSSATAIISQLQKHPPDQPGVDRLRCRRRKKRKKKKRKCFNYTTCPNKPFAIPKRKCASPIGSETSCIETPNKFQANSKRKCTSSEEDTAANNQPNKPQSNSKRKCNSEEVDSTCTDKPKKPPINAKRKCFSSGEDDDVTAPYPPKRNTTMCDSTDECQRIPYNKLVSKKTNKINRFTQNVHLRAKKKKNKKLKNIKNKRVLQKNKIIEVTSSRVETTVLADETETMQVQTDADMSSISTTEAVNTSITKQRDVIQFTSEEDYSSRSASSASDEADDVQEMTAASWEDPFIPPYPEPTSEAPM